MIASDFSNIVSFPKKSNAGGRVVQKQSHTLFADYKSKKVVVKLSYIRNIPLMTDVECDIYKHIIPSLHPLTPHLIKFVDLFEESIDTCIAVFGGGIIDELAYSFDFHTPSKPLKLNVLITERCEGKSLADMASTMSVVDATKVLFQILQLLSCFHSHGFVHGDLHPGNVLVETKEDNQEYEILYMIPYKTIQTPFTLKTKYLVKIYDFDFSTIHNKNVRMNYNLDIYFNKHMKSSVYQLLYTDVWMVFYIFLKYIGFYVKKECPNYSDQLYSLFFNPSALHRKHLSAKLKKLDFECIISAVNQETIPSYRQTLYQTICHPIDIMIKIIDTNMVNITRTSICKDAEASNIYLFPYNTPSISKSTVVNPTKDMFKLYDVDEIY